MQHHFDGRIGRGRIDQIGAFNREEFFIRDRLESAQIPQWRQANRRQAFRFDRGHVGARSLDPQDLDFVAEQVAGTRLQRSVAAAMQHQFRIGTEQSCAVDAEAPHRARCRPRRRAPRFPRLQLRPICFSWARVPKKNCPGFGSGQPEALRQDHVRPRDGAPVINRRRSVVTTSRYGVVDRRFRFRRLR